MIARVGNKNALARKIVDYCANRNDLVDIVEICSPLSEKALKEISITEKQQVIGYVYLLKSGKYYKIGRSNAPGRREREIALHMPEESKMIHKISTDDPAGIEAYWHNRFAKKRLNGEWFALSNEEMLAFRRRRYM